MPEDFAELVAKIAFETEPCIFVKRSMTAANHTPATYVIGHRNPDTDAICSAIAYTAYKEARGEKGYVAARCGNSNARIDTVLQRFHQPLPLYLSDVTPRVCDVMISSVLSVQPTATCAEALELIDEHDVRILPVTTADNRVVGSICAKFTPRSPTSPGP
jgi:manganese-dependent inorganic pyrophosphatase